MSSLLVNLLETVAIVMLADFVAGVVHWLQDAYGSPDTPVIGRLLIRVNIVHHHYPRFFTRLTWWQSSWDLLLVGAGLVLAGWWTGVLGWQLWLFVAISINANQVHKWSHRTRAENGPVITFLQKIRVLQTPRHHALHHSDPKNTYYCPITNLVNPLLERIRFWTAVESLIEWATGHRHRHDTSNRGQGPGPAWLSDYAPVSPAVAKAPCDACPRLDPAHRAACTGVCVRPATAASPAPHPSPFQPATHYLPASASFASSDETCPTSHLSRP